MHYYNENDLKAAAWLHELMNAGQIPKGHIDTRSIHEVRPNDLAGFIQCHFFAGIGGWPYALRLAGWAQDKPCWTGSCPCQPYSSAGKGLGDADPRNLWPVWFELIKECRPDIIFGEQVASAIRYGWLDGISTDLEAQGYACGSCVLGAHSVGAPHIRQRLYWVADSNCGRRKECYKNERNISEPYKSCNTSRLDITDSDGRNERQSTSSIDGHGHTSGSDGNAGGLDNSKRIGWRESGNNDGEHDRLITDSTVTARWMGEPIQQGLEGYTGNGSDGHKSRRDDQEAAGSTPAPSSPWDAYELLPCTDGKARRIEPGSFPLAHGVSGRVGLLRGYGNAIVPQDAAVFIQAFQETIESR